MTEQDRIAIVVPARGGSLGIRRKNLMKVGGISLVNRSISHALAFGPNFPVILSTDNQEILDSVLNFLGYEPTDLANHNPDTIFKVGDLSIHFRSSTYSDSKALIGVTLQSLRLILTNSGQHFKGWCLLQPTSPFRSSSEINRIADELIHNFNCDSSWVSVALVQNSHPSRIYRIGLTGYLNPLIGFEGTQHLRRQDLEPMYLRDGSFYVIGDNLVKEGRQYSDNPRPLIRESPWTVNIDELADLVLAEYFADKIAE